MRLPQVRVNKTIVLTGLVAFAGGAVVGYILGSRKAEYETVIYQIPDDPKDENQMSLFDPQVPKERIPAGFDSTKGITLEESAETMTGLTADDYRKSWEAYNENNPEWDWDAELAKRNPERPYILHYEEFMQNEPGFTQTTITYFAGDNILCDEEDVPIYKIEETVGVLVFGHGSNDRNVVYVRNEKLRMDWEILFSASSYESEVLGIDAQNELSKDIKHAVQKFRRE